MLWVDRAVEEAEEDQSEGLQYRWLRVWAVVEAGWRG